MLAWALVFLIISLIAAAFWLSGSAIVSSTMIQVVFVAFLVLFLITLIVGLARKPPNV
ncbi:MAG TPA: DUF1328 domain-containing protein [Chitinispirillaceae bacterium]|jgi:uncharacterized membrane protein YtjA (UPF0391 family)|nr:DUF1328 domain-containing protein [Chitinispirillaceae bacterium]